MDDLAELRESELGNDPPTLREVCEAFDRRDDFAQESLADLGHLQLEVPGPNRLQVNHGRFGEANNALAGHGKEGSSGA